MNNVSGKTPPIQLLLKLIHVCCANHPCIPRFRLNYLVTSLMEQLVDRTSNNIKTGTRFKNRTTNLCGLKVKQQLFSINSKITKNKKVQKQITKNVLRDECKKLLSASL